jgi:glycosyltransferase involved in cell wall biosynthesis
MFETDRLPEGWNLRLNQMNQVWVPTEFARKIFVDGGVDAEKLRVLGEPVDTTFFNPDNLSEPMKIPGKGENTFVFLSIFKWEERKGWDILLEAYFSEFSKEDDVLLVILTNAYHSNDNFEEVAMKHIKMKGGGKHDDMSRLPKVYFQPHVSQNKLPSLFAASDVFVLPSRGEGWGRPHVEAMSMQVPVIATNWGGPTEYMSGLNSFPLKTNGLKVIKEGAFKGHLWANPSTAHLRELLRYVLSHPEEVKKKGIQARRDMIEKFSVAAMGEKLRQLLEEVEVQMSEKNTNTNYNSEL